MTTLPTRFCFAVMSIAGAAALVAVSAPAVALSPAHHAAGTAIASIAAGAPRG